jgi:hypothetical protein
MVTPTMFPVEKKKRRAQKKLEDTNVLIPWYPISYLMIASSVFFGGALTGPYIPDGAIWWCLRTGGGGVLTRMVLGCDFFERRGENVCWNTFGVPFFLFQMASYVFV